MTQASFFWSQGITRSGSRVSLGLKYFSHTPSMDLVKFEENTLKALQERSQRGWGADGTRW